MAINPAAASAAPQITGAIRQAAQSTGISFEYLLTTAKIESNFNPSAQASTSSAKGLYQFIDQTWLGTSCRRCRPIFHRSHHRALRPPGADPRESSGTRGPVCADAASSALEAIASAGRVRDGAPMCSSRSMLNLPQGKPAKRRQWRSPLIRVTTKWVRLCSTFVKADSSRRECSCGRCCPAT